MLKKLVKYDLKWINKYMIYYFMISIIFAIVTRGISYKREIFIWNIIYGVFRGIEISCMISIIINCLIRIWVRFKNNIYKDESYLIHTIPVEKKTIFSAKVIASIISTLISIIVIAICALIVWLDEPMIEQIKTIFSDSDWVVVLILTCIVSILEFIFIILCGIIGTEIGHKRNNLKNLRSVLMSLMFYLIPNMFNIVIIYCIGMFNPEIGQLFSENVENIIAIKQLLWTCVGIYIVYNCILFCIGKRTLEQGVNVD